MICCHDNLMSTRLCTHEHMRNIINQMEQQSNAALVQCSCSWPWMACHTYNHAACREAEQSRKTPATHKHTKLSLMARHHFDNRKFLPTINGNHANDYLFIFHQDVFCATRRYANVEELVSKVDEDAKQCSPSKSNFHKIFTKSVKLFLFLPQLVNNILRHTGFQIQCRRDGSEMPTKKIYTKDFSSQKMNKTW